VRVPATLTPVARAAARLGGPDVAGGWRWLDNAAAVKEVSAPRHLPHMVRGASSRAPRLAWQVNARAQAESTQSVLSFFQLPPPAAELGDGLSPDPNLCSCCCGHASLCLAGRLAALRGLADGLPPTFFCAAGSGSPVCTTDI
jgi:hypothetical protein